MGDATMARITVEDVKAALAYAARVVDERRGVYRHELPSSSLPTACLRADLPWVGATRNQLLAVLSDVLLIRGSASRDGDLDPDRLRL